ncbi:MAG: hypothetical protein WA478_00005, partial [Pseudolabrys sp.]
MLTNQTTTGEVQRLFERRPGDFAVNFGLDERLRSARDQLRRRCTDVITSTCVLVMGVVLGIILGLAAITQTGKAVLTGRLPRA